VDTLRAQRSKTSSTYRKRVKDVLWPELNGRTAASNLRQIVHAARWLFAANRVVAAEYLAASNQ